MFWIEVDIIVSRLALRSTSARAKDAQSGRPARWMNRKGSSAIVLRGSHWVHDELRDPAGGSDPSINDSREPCMSIPRCLMSWTG